VINVLDGEIKFVVVMLGIAAMLRSTSHGPAVMMFVGRLVARGALSSLTERQCAGDNRPDLMCGTRRPWSIHAHLDCGT
jgi:hypothetical protein